jgi:hypothetical protein
MSSNSNNEQNLGRAENSFRSAFERLKANKPNLLSRGTQVTQSNVAREAGVDPSALKKSRFPRLVAEIQAWISWQMEASPISGRQLANLNREKTRNLRERLRAMKIQRDLALGLLAEADSCILELTLENERLRVLKTPNNVIPIREPRPKN